MKAILSLTAFEYKKLARQKSAVIMTLLAISFSILAAILNIFGGGYYSAIGTDLSASRALAADRQAIREHRGTVDEAYLKNVASSIRKVLDDPDSYFTDQRGNSHLKPETDLEYILPYYHVYFFLGDIAQKINGESSADYPQNLLTPDQMTGFYHTYHELLTDSIASNARLTPAEKEKQTAMAERIRTPFYNDYNQGFGSFKNMLPMVGMIILALISVLCAGIFGNEYSDRTAALVLSSKHGKNKCIAAKLLTGLSLSALYSTGLCLIYLSSFLMFHGFTGGSTPLQFLPGFGCSLYPVTVLQSVLITIAATSLVSMMFGTLVMLLSALIRKPYIAVTAALLLSFFPAFIPSSDDRLITQLVNLLPMRAFDYSAIFSQYFYCIGKFVFTPAAFYVLFSLGTMAILIPAAWQSFRHHQIQ